MTEKPSDHPCNTISSMRDYFTLWLEKLESFYQERDKRYEERFNAQEKAVAFALSAAERAVSKAETATEKRFESVNEFRNTLSDQAKNFLSRSEYLTAHNSIEEKIGNAGIRIERIEGRSGGLSAMWGYVVGALGVGATIVAIIFYILNTVKLVGH